MSDSCPDLPARSLRVSPHIQEMFARHRSIGAGESVRAEARTTGEFDFLCRHSTIRWTKAKLLGHVGFFADTKD